MLSSFIKNFIFFQFRLHAFVTLELSPHIDFTLSSRTKRYIRDFISQFEEPSWLKVNFPFYMRTCYNLLKMFSGASQKTKYDHFTKSALPTEYIPRQLLLPPNYVFAAAPARRTRLVGMSGVGVER